MKLPLLTVAAALALHSLALTAHAQTAAKPATKSAGKAAPKASVKSAAKPTTPVSHIGKKIVRQVEAHTPVQSPSDRLTDAERALAATVQTGHIKCELGAFVTVKADEQNPGFFHISTGRHKFYMHPVESRTGALRLEDNRAGALWLQLANKSMLMDQRAGQRLADDCMTDSQQNVTNDMKTKPPVNLLEDPGQRTL